MPSGPQSINTSVPFNNKTLSQVLSQTIVNAYLQVKINPELKNRFVPAFLASDNFITIHMYNPAHDILLTQSRAMEIFEGDNLSHFTILSVYFALNMCRFSVCPPGDESYFDSFQKSDFQSIVGPTLKIYKSDLRAPLDCTSCVVKSSPNMIWFHDSVQRTSELMQIFRTKSLKK